MRQANHYNKGKQEKCGNFEKAKGGISNVPKQHRVQHK
jgi:hypothetical protein